MQVSGIGRVIFWGGANLWIGLPGQPVPLHSHHAIQIAIGFSEPVEFRLSEHTEWTRYPGGALVRPGAFHEFKAPGRRLANVLFEPEATLGRALLQRYGSGPIVPLDADVNALARAFEDGADDDVLIAEAMALIGRLAGADAGQQTTDPRILAAIAFIAEHIDEPLSLSQVAAVAGLSEGRLRHLFVSETGIAFRPYVLWTRLNRALELGFSGTSWTEAAHATNFADSAHLTRTCRRMYGLVPTSMRIEHPAQTGRHVA